MFYLDLGQIDRRTIICHYQFSAAKHILSIGGGLVVVDDEQVTASLPLPIAGLMSDQSIKSVISNLNAVNEACRKLGGNVIKDPFMLHSKYICCYYQ
ncbi:MAG TPA: adenine deaminase C-terminal domain-containing protein [Nitrososphaeraceae archaeon]|nr:adenine deaminase C-terminal domain-containing protein [Nitrososphaeraceae archaeon]